MDTLWLGIDIGKATFVAAMMKGRKLWSWESSITIQVDSLRLSTLCKQNCRRPRSCILWWSQPVATRRQQSPLATSKAGR